MGRSLPFLKSSGGCQRYGARQSFPDLPFPDRPDREELSGTGQPIHGRAGSLRCEYKVLATNAKYWENNRLTLQRGRMRGSLRRRLGGERRPLLLLWRREEELD